MAIKTPFIGLGVGAAAGVALAATAAREHGYVAAYTLIWAGLIGIVLLVFAVLLLFFRRSRRWSPASATAGVGVFIACYATMALMAHSGVWKHEMEEFGPHVSANLVVLFRDGAEDREISEFVQTVLSVPDPRGGEANPAGVSSVLLVRVDRHKGYAINFRSNATAEQISNLQTRIETHRIVWRTFSDIAPNEIDLQSIRGVTPNPSLQRTPPG